MKQISTRVGRMGGDERRKYRTGAGKYDRIPGIMELYLAGEV